MMSADDVIEVLERLEAAGVWVWLDGGWGVNALLIGRQTRPHDDLDATIDLRDVLRAQTALAPLGFRHDPMVQPELLAQLVMRDTTGRQVEVHPVLFDEVGDGWQELGGGARGDRRHRRANGPLHHAGAAGPAPPRLSA